MKEFISEAVSHELNTLKKMGCTPGLYRRGSFWRAHVNIAGNYWADDTTPLRAVLAAKRLWVDAGKPMDGIASEGAP